MYNYSSPDFVYIVGKCVCVSSMLKYVSFSGYRSLESLTPSVKFQHASPKPRWNVLCSGRKEVKNNNKILIHNYYTLYQLCAMVMDSK